MVYGPLSHDKLTVNVFALRLHVGCYLGLIQFRFFLISFMHDHTRCKPARDYLLSHSAEWQWAVGWLRKKVRHIT